MVMSAVRDIIDRKKAEQKFRGLLESAPDAMVIVARDGTIALVNSQTERLFGYGRGDLLGRPVEILAPHRFRTRHQENRGGFFGHPRARAMGQGLQLFGLLVANPWGRRGIRAACGTKSLSPPTIGASYQALAFPSPSSDSPVTALGDGRVVTAKEGD
jgi:PAS domain-containing protein